MIKSGALACGLDMAQSPSISEQGDRIEGVPARYWHRMDDGRLQCDLCPRYCRLHDGQRGLCFVRARDREQIVLTTYGRSSGFFLDPIA
jgi:pyruvate formate lyase activating enzyme